MAQRLFNLARQAGKARTQLLALSGAAGALAAVGLSDEPFRKNTGISLPGFTPVALADSRTEAQQSAAPASRSPATISLTGFEDVKDVYGFVSAALDKTLKYQKSSPLHTMVASTTGLTNTSPQKYDEQVPAPVIDPTAFYGLLEKQPLSEKVMVLDDIVDSVIREAERSAEVLALTVGMVGGGVACYALLGWWSDLALPGVGTVACSAVAGAAGHNRAKAAAKQTRSRFLNAILSAAPPSGRNTFIDFLAAPSLDVKQRIASDTHPATFFRDFYNAIQPLLKQVPMSLDSTEAVMSMAA